MGLRKVLCNAFGPDVSARFSRSMTDRCLQQDNRRMELRTVCSHINTHGMDYAKHKSELTSHSNTTGALRVVSLAPASFFHDKAAYTTA
jgi:hypothetical protein